MPGLTVLIVDDHPVYRRGLRAVLEDAEWVGRVVEAAGVEESLRLAVLEQADVVAMDLALPDGSGLDATARITRARPDAAVLILTMTNDPAIAEALIPAGARGYLLKDSDGEVIADALRAVSTGMLVLGPHLRSGRITVDAPGHRRITQLDTLSAREREILTELARGRTNLQIGRRLGLSEKTVRNRLSAIYAKLQVTDRTQAALRAHDCGLDD